MKLRKFLLRYYPPGIILEYEQARAVWERGEEAGRPGGGKGGKEETGIRQTRSRRRRAAETLLPAARAPA